jgi:hypothetical protein
MEELLLNKLTKELPKRNTTCLRNILILAMGMIQKETVCLNKIKGAIGAITRNTTTKPESHYKRLIRIFDRYALSSLWLELLQCVFRLLRLKSDYLLLDGTSWQRGSRQFHYLTLGVVYQGVAIPIYWEDLQKKGNSNLKERKNIIQKALKYYNLKDKILLADREYIGEDWFCFLKKHQIDFVIRLRKKNYKEAVNAAEGKSYGTLERKVLRSRKADKAIGKAIWLKGQPFTFVIVKNARPNAAEPLIYLLSTLMEAASSIAVRYPIRWQIETCFKHLKSNGFELEEINLKGRSRTKLLMAVVVFAYTLAVHEGLKEYKKVSVKRYADGTTAKACSVFRDGLDKVNACCYNLIGFCSYLIENLINKLPTYRSKQAIIV